MKLVIIFLYSFLCFSYCISQEATISGTVLDSTEQKPLYLANVILLQQNDSLYKAMTTSEKGEFSFSKLTKGTYKIDITYVGFKPYSKTFEFNNKSIDLGKIFLADDLMLLDSVSVEGIAPAVVLKQDTVEFNSSAYKTTSEANLEDLLKKMPGLEVKDGKLTSQGEVITKIIVDGKPFFQNSPEFTLKNLPADMVSKIQVIDEKSKEAIYTGHDDGKREKVLNVVTKPEKRRGYFSTLGLTYSPPERYLASGNINFIRGKDRFSFSGSFNNLSSGGGERYIDLGGGQGMVNVEGIGSNGGISQQSTFRTYYYSEIIPKLTANASYSYRGAITKSINETSQQYIQAADSGRVYNQRSERENNNISHSTSLSLEYKPSDNNRFTLRQSFSLSEGKNTSHVTGNTFMNDEEINSTNNRNFSELDGNNWSSSFSWWHKFSKKGRTISINSSLGQSESTGIDSVRSINRFSTGNVSNQDYDQFSKPEDNTNRFSTQVSYTEPIGEKQSLKLSYKRDINKTDNKNLLLNYNNNESNYTDIDTLRSSQYNNLLTKDEFNSGIQFKVGDINISAGAKYQLQRIENDQTFPRSTALDRRFDGFLPNVNLSFRNKEGKQIRLNYSRSMGVPQASQLQDVLNNSNPLFLRRGNPQLSESYSNRLTLTYAIFNKDTKSYISFNLSGGTTENTVVNNTIIGNGSNSPDGIELPVGARLSTPVNMSGRRNMNGSVNISKPIEKWKLNVQVGGSASFSRSPQFLNGIIQVSENANYGIGFGINSNFSKKLDISLSTRPGFSNVKNPSNEAGNRRYSQMASSLRGTYKSESGIFITTSLTHQQNGKVGNIDGTNQLIWNMSFGKSFFKKKMDFSITASDLLRQSSVINRNVTSEYIQNSETNVLRQIIRFRLGYKLNKFGGK
ncbi:TonB-dependent receptor [Roseivirga sp.]|uniref:TonB-dependent receptor n=1 Tax=Roseivirga sp. TaxID=1964215 RepID=UPI002B26B93F|nr:TonB-dependent receptor [Roseivirga sp.]